MTAINKIKWRENVRIERIETNYPIIDRPDDFYMDPETAAMAAALIEKDGALWHPRVKAEISPMIYGGEDYRETYFGYLRRSPIYADWYRVLAYTTFGHGNWSNNDRRHNGLPPLRKRRKGRR